ncbi:glutamate synthase alpha subunit domain protein [Methanothermus fervidus DSM 2088]|uniref:Glutamate synthase alpha subunit domain protein n=1 Tax=Methanothermus fervidus (strain ATCC 43054 / DSM 2088 / JCM 10308 / V24 S) TaxID=523846 RepID=E3GX20_METFV|nr:hypothetical protein [Methanothermus fervidus]ADP76909.1 glutamate synthase alpha subunit domain protein [Methanothermus fervidus DSM 2088]
MFKIFKRKKRKKEILELELEEPVDCIADFTYNFYWQHKGKYLKPEDTIPGTEYRYKDVVEHLKKGNDVKIIGDVGHRLCSSMGVDLKYFGGTGGAIDVGNVIVDGNVDTRMGISMLRGSIYVKGKVKEPIGNLVEVKSDMKGYKKFRSITDIVTNGLGEDELIGAELKGNRLTINDGRIRDTIGARLDVEAEIIHKGDVDLSTGILMKKGVVIVKGDAGKNTGALLSGGTVIIDGNTGDFSGIDMKDGILIINGDAGKFLGAQMKGGKIFVKSGKPLPNISKANLNNKDKTILAKYGFKPYNFKKFIVKK